MRSRCSTSRSIRTPPPEDTKPPSNVATTDLPETGDRPGNGSVELIMADVVSQKCCGFESITESYAQSKAKTNHGLQSNTRPSWSADHVRPSEPSFLQSASITARNLVRQCDREWP